ncbi:hypothetical protein TRVA0_030S00474 [Trichomonascus vanleenenianus]|uniref:homoserine O-acetyltransferase n=1 Tax=Trichomonascus vanleenenianus TaxID=2268995 RepID=UPI003ECB9A8A
MGKFKRVTEQPENPFFKLVTDQQVAVIPEFELESGEILREVPLAYKTFGKLNSEANNALVICHALTGSADVADWWGPMVGPGRAFDPTKFFLVCINALGSPYGSASPCTKNPETGDYYGPEFPLVTVKDDCRIQKMLLDDLGVRQIAAVIGGSMGGMLVLEYAYFGPEYVRCIVPLATCATHSAWGISWGEAQRQSIYSDPKYNDGYYPFDDPPVAGLGAARMSAMLTYRSRNSFENKFGRGVPNPQKHKGVKEDAREPTTPSEERWAIHNHGHQHGKRLSRSSSSASIQSLSNSSSSSDLSKVHRPQHYFSAQSYLRYQGQKFVQRFDSNCYISITRKLDTHDVSRGRADTVAEALAMITQPTLVIGISSDGLFTFTEQERLAEYIPNAQLAEIKSPEGHDAFLLEFVEINTLIVKFLAEMLPDIMRKDGQAIEIAEVGELGKSSLFGEAEVDDGQFDVTSW